MVGLEVTVLVMAVLTRIPQQAVKVEEEEVGGRAISRRKRRKRRKQMASLIQKLAAAGSLRFKSIWEGAPLLRKTKHRRSQRNSWSKRNSKKPKKLKSIRKGARKRWQTIRPLAKQTEEQQEEVEESKQRSTKRRKAVAVVALAEAALAVVSQMEEAGKLGQGRVVEWVSLGGTKRTSALDRWS